MSWIKTLLDGIRDAIIEADHERRYPQDTSSYEDDPQDYPYAYTPDELEEELAPRPPDGRVTDIPLHFNARPGEYEEEE